MVRTPFDLFRRSLICIRQKTQAVKDDFFVNTVESRNKGSQGTNYCYRRSSTIANIGGKEKSFQGTTKLLLFLSVIGGFPLLLDPV